MTTTESLHIVQITDLHLFAKPESKLLGVVTEQTFQLVLSEVAQLSPQPDVILLTGDLSQDGSVQAYARLKDVMRSLGINVYWLAGNHDRLPNMISQLAGEGFSCEKAFSQRGWAFVLLNSLLPGKDSGYLTTKNLNFLKDQLLETQEQGLHAVVCLHHPPFLVESEWLDTSTLQHSERFFAVLDEFSHVRLVMFGHIHQEFYCVRHGVEYMGCPSTCIQFQPKSREFSLEVIPPGYRKLWLYTDGSLKTELVRVPQALMQPDLHLGGY